MLPSFAYSIQRPAWRLSRAVILLAVILLIVMCGLGGAFHTAAQNETGAIGFRPARATTAAASTSLVISQVYGGGGANTGTPAYKNDYVELLNISTAPVSLNGLALQYGSATGNFGSMPINIFALPDVNLQPGQYFFVQLGSGGALGADYPVAPDVVTANLNLSATSGKVALTANATALNCGATAMLCALPNAAIVDLVSYGAGTNGEGGTTAGNNTPLTNQQAAVRKGAGCTDTDNNAADFLIIAAPVPRNSQSTANTCGNGGAPTNPSGVGSANPATAMAGDAALLTVAVSPGQNPVSTNLQVTGDLSALGGAGSQQFYDDGTNGDAVAGDLIFSYTITVPSASSGGGKTLPAAIRDAQGRTGSTNIALNVLPVRSANEHLVLGNPSNAVADQSQPDNYLLLKAQYAVGYNNSRGIPNWVAWHLDKTWLGSAPRQDDFRPDASLPAGFYQVQSTDYSGTGFDRGHHTPSADRTATVPDNSQTFLMSNMMPQAPDNNQGPWEVLESYCRGLVGQGNELYIITGGAGEGGVGSNGGVTKTIANGRVTVPAYTWKIIVVLPEQDGDDAARINRTTRVIVVIMPNAQGIRATDWHTFRTNVQSVETLTGLKFLTGVRSQVRRSFRYRVDTQQ